MHEDKPCPGLWISPVDRKGRRVDPRVIEAAILKWPDMFSFARRRLRDLSDLQDIAEKVVHWISSMMNKGHGRNIERLPHYVFVCFQNEINRHIERETFHEYKPSDDFDFLPDMRTLRAEASIICDILLGEFLSSLDDRKRNLIVMRLEGYSWEAVARMIGGSPASARVTYCNIIKSTRKNMNRKNSKASAKGRNRQ